MVEKSVANLVEALTDIGLKTWYSCEGHMKYRHHHPWIRMGCYLSGRDALKILIKTYNEHHELKWKLDGISLEPLGCEKWCSSCTEVRSV